MKNFLYLIDTSTIDLMVTLFIITKNKSGNLILIFVSNQGPLKDLKKFYTSDAYLGVKESEYQNEDSTFVKSFLPQFSKSLIVAATIFSEKGSQNLNPFGIRILKNKMTMNIPKMQPIENSEYVVLATMNSAELKATNDILTIISGDSRNCKCFEFFLSEESETFCEQNLPIEKKSILSDISVIKKEFHTEFGDFVEYKNGNFDENWRRKVLYTMDEFFLEDSQILIPRIDGSWDEDYVEGVSFPFWKLKESKCTKKDWINFLKEPDNFPVQIIYDV